MIKNILYIMCGGAIGATLRYLVGQWSSNWHFTTMPIGTLLVNIIGCFLMGLLMGLSERFTTFPREIYLMLTVGLCGAFTTFSTFSADTFHLMDSGHFLTALSYIVLSIALGFTLFYIGRLICK